MARLATETEWLSCTDPGQVSVIRRGSMRQRRLIGAAIIRRPAVWAMLPEASRHLVCLMDGGYDWGSRWGTHADREMDQAVRAAGRAWRDHLETDQAMPAHAALDLATSHRCSGVSGTCSWGVASASASGSPRRAEAEAAERVEHMVCVRCVLGNPFRRPRAGRWRRDATVLSLARATYDNRSLPAGHLDPVRLAVLADALEDAGCRDEHALGHLRGPGPHWRGCYVLDKIREASLRAASLWDVGGPEEEWFSHDPAVAELMSAG